MSNTKVSTGGARMNVRLLLIGGLVAALVAGFGVAFLGQPGGAADPDDPEQVARGQVVYAASCASCHGERLEGQPDWRSRKADDKLPAPPHDESGHTWHHPDDVLFGITKKGIAGYAPPNYQSDMPAFGGVLSDEEIWAVLAYIKSRWPTAIQERQALLSQKAGK